MNIVVHYNIFKKMQKGLWDNYTLTQQQPQNRKYTVFMSSQPSKISSLNFLTQLHLFPTSSRSLLSPFLTASSSEFLCLNLSLWLETIGRRESAPPSLPTPSLSLPFSLPPPTSRRTSDIILAEETLAAWPYGYNVHSTNMGNTQSNSIIEWKLIKANSRVPPYHHEAYIRVRVGT